MAAAAGFSLILACDLTIAARNAVFAIPYIQAAHSPDADASWSLTRATPKQLATELLLTSGSVSAQRLHELSVINRLYESGRTLEGAMQWANQLNLLDPNAVASIKDLPRQLDLEREHFGRNLHHINAGIGIDTFLNQKTPRYDK